MTKLDAPLIFALDLGTLYGFGAPKERPRQCANTYRGLTPKSVTETRLP